MSYLDWKIGDKIVCLDDSPGGRSSRPVKVLVRGQIYTIRGFAVSNGMYRGVIGNKVVVELIEAFNPFTYEGESDGFAAARFRKVQSRNSDISIFTAMLNPKKQVVDA